MRRVKHILKNFVDLKKKKLRNGMTLLNNYQIYYSKVTKIN